MRECTRIDLVFLLFSSLTKPSDFLKQLEFCFLNEAMLVYPLFFLTKITVILTVRISLIRKYIGD